MRTSSVLRTPHPLGATLPGLYQDDRFTQGLCGGLDDVLAPVVGTLDSFWAYLDPQTAPDDMLEWLAGWLGMTLDDGQSPLRRRELLCTGIELLRWRGTARGVRDAVGALFDTVPEVEESGAADWSTDPQSGLPGTSGARLLVRLRVPDPSVVNIERLDAVVAAVKPAHVMHRVEVRSEEQ